MPLGQQNTGQNAAGTNAQVTETTVLEIVKQMRKDARRGQTARVDFENNPQFIQAAGAILGRAPHNYDEAWGVLSELAFGSSDY